MSDPPEGQLRSTESAEGMTGTAYLAPDFPEPRALFNTLRVRPQYRITLRLGQIEHLFRHEPNTREGRMERLQVLGLFYFPLEHRQAATAYTACWEWVREKTFMGVADEAAGDREVQRWLREWVVELGRLPERAEDPEDPDDNRNFGKIRIPGGYAFMDANTPPHLNRDGRPNYRFSFGADLYQMETRYYRDNPVLRKIPLVARVERQMTPGGEWEAAPNVTVYFQLVRPYDLPEFDALNTPTGQYNRPNLRGEPEPPPTPGDQPAPQPIPPPAPTGPARIVVREEQNKDENDPQLNNCRRQHGGERGRGNLADGSDVADVIFRVQSTPGFNEAHTTPVARELPHPPYPVAERVRPSGQSHRHAIKALTNEQGEAGVIFMLSRCGGDRYRFRVYIGPPTLPSDGTDEAAVRVETGTFVLWRNVRISRYLRIPGNAPHATLLAQVNQPPYGIANSNEYLDRFDVTHATFVITPTSATTTYTNVGLATADFERIGDNSTTFDGIKQQFAKAFCEIETDSYLRGPETLTQEEWNQAMERAIEDGMTGRSRVGLNRLNVRLLLCREAGTTTAPNPTNVNNATACIPMRTARAYNAAVAQANQRIREHPANSGWPHPSWRQNIQALFENYLAPGFMRRLTRDGRLPGLTIIQGAAGCTWQLFGGRRGIPRYSGLALHYRGGYVWLGNDAYSPRIRVAPGGGGRAWYDFTSNCCHELGHCQSREHAPGPLQPRQERPAGVQAHEHDRHEHNICVMSYDTCEGQYCALCLLALRGWDARRVRRD